MCRFCFLLLLAALYPFVAMCQQVEERLILKDPGDSLLIKAFRTAFDSNGNYYFEVPQKGNGDKFNLITNTKKKSTVYWGKSIATSPYKALLADAFFSDTSHKKVYYKNKSGTRLYGPRAGRVRSVLEYGRENIVIELCVGETSSLYINDSLVNVTDSLLQKWLCSFSDNGHVIYMVYHRGVYELYVDYVKKDTSVSPFTDLAINNSGFYIYVKGDNGKFFVHTSLSKYGPLGAVDGGDLWNNGAWFYRGCADSSCYVLVNGKLFNNIPESHSLVEDDNGVVNYKSDEIITVQPADKNNFLFSYNQNNKDGIFTNVNGKITHHNYSRTSFIFYDKRDSYAFYGSRQDSFGIDHTFKNINGAEKKLPYYKKGQAHAQCMQIEPDSSSLYFFTTDDSIYLFRNDTLLCPPASRKKFLQLDASALPQTHPEGNEFFMGFNITDKCYILYNNSLSKPMPLIKPEYDRLEVPHKGSVVAGDLAGHGFFIMVNIGPGKYLLNINNKVYQEMDGIDYIFGDQSYFSDHSLVMFGIKGTSFYEFKVRF